MLKVFIDTNIFLDFYSLSERDIDELHKLIKLINDKEIQLILPQNVIDEFHKNRIKKIHSTTSCLDKSNQIPAPTILKQYTLEYEEFRAAQANLKEKFNLLKDKLISDVKAEQLSADKIIKEIFAKATVIPINKVFYRAQQRFMRRLPPRKNDNNDSMGDAINWETLKYVIDENNDLHIVSGDGDFWDSIEGQNDVAKYYLAKEWKDEKNATLYIYANIKDFFDKKFSSYNFVVDKEKSQLIDKLVESKSFAMTHDTIGELQKYNPNDFTLYEVNLILHAYQDNYQIFRIDRDEDVKNFFYKITQPKKEQLDLDLYLDVLHDIAPEKMKEEIPF